MSFIDVTTLLNLISPQCNVKRCFLALDSLNSWVNIRLPKIQQSEPGKHLVVQLTVHLFLTNTLYQLYYMFYPIYTCIYIYINTYDCICICICRCKATALEASSFSSSSISASIPLAISRALAWRCCAG